MAALGDSQGRSVLRGRSRECRALDRLLDEVRSGRSSVFVIRGAAGVGKTALLTYVEQRASECRIARTAGVESEMELAFAGLHQLCGPMLHRLEHLPDPQREALRVASGLRGGDPPDRFLVGLAVLNLLAEVAEERPLVCLVDDAQWLDRASQQALAFVARRLLAEPIALVLAVRETGDDDRELRNLPEMVVKGLGDRDARLLLASGIPGRLDERVLDRIVAEARGNPLALLELPRGLSRTELATGFGLPDTRSLSSRIEQSFLRQFESYPSDTQQLLLTAAAEPVGDVLLLWRAAALLGLGEDAAAPAEADGLLEVGARVRFRHPLVRSAIYRAASLQSKQRVHRALAQVTDAELDPDRRAWHRAQAAPRPDEEVAVALEFSADRAQARGGVAAAAILLERAAALTPDPARRASRALAAARAKHQSGAPYAALDLLAMADAGPLDELRRAEVELLRAQVAFAVNRGKDAPPLLLSAAKKFEPLDIGLARDTYLDALLAAMFAGSQTAGGLVNVAAAIRAAPRPAGPPRAPDLLMDGLALRITEGYPAGAPVLKQALRAFVHASPTYEEGMRWHWLACHTAHEMWDDETWTLLSERHVRLTRDGGDLTELPLALIARIYMHLYAGELSTASLLIGEVEAVIEATESHLAPYGALELAALQGREGRTLELVRDRTVEVTARGEGMGLTLIHDATALLYIGLGRYADALAAARQGKEHQEELGVSTWALPELIEAAVRSDVADVAADALGRLTETTSASGTEWALGIQARARALLSRGGAAETLYREAIDRLAHTKVRLELARAHLLYGEWLRRESRRQDARLQLHTAHEMLSGMGADGFAQRARRELLATGEKAARRRTVETLVDLTAQEAQIAQMARDGRTNGEIGSRLFISPRTVEWHLGNVFTKLGITSRRELHGALPNMGRAVLA